MRRNASNCFPIAVVGNKIFIIIEKAQSIFYSKMYDIKKITNFTAQTVMQKPGRGLCGGMQT